MTASATPTESETTSLLVKDGNDLDRPFTGREKVKLTSSILLLPWVFFVPLLYLGAWVRTRPDYPPIFLGLWWMPLTLMVARLCSWINLLDRPSIVRERWRKHEFSGGEKPQEPWREHVAQGLLLVFSLVGLFISAFDAAGRVYTHQPDLPLAVYITGSLLLVASVMLISWVLRVNKFASKVVYKQPGQQLVTTGPYAYVRHPFYTFMIPLSIGWPWTIGSLVWGLIPSLLTIPVLMWRTYHEEDFLVQEFGEAYEQYRQDVPFRMIPWVF